MANTRVFQKPDKQVKRNLPNGYRPMEHQEVWNWGYYEGIQAAVQWLNRFGVATHVQNQFQQEMAHVQQKISNATFSGDCDNVKWT